MKKNKWMFGLAVCAFCFVGCETGDGELNLDDGVTDPPINTNTVPSTTKSTLPEELYWLHQNAESGSEYVIELTGSGNIGAQSLSFTNVNDVTIHLVGKDRERAIQLTDNGSLFRIGAGVTLVVGENITLRGHDRNNTPLVFVESRGTLIMEAGSKISGNTNTSWNADGGGIHIAMDGSFVMKGGDVSNHNASSSSSRSGGVNIADGGYFSMEGGRVTNNRANVGGGVGIANGFFIMSGGEILNNTSDRNGGGVYMSNGIFDMSGGVISGNTSGTSSTNYDGGGVYVSNATFTMTGGEIFGNTARSGGGVFVDVGWNNTSSMTKTGGTIFGYTLGDPKRNTATTGITSNDRGHAVFVNSSPSKRRETTAGVAINLNSEILGAAGGWE